MAEVLAALGGAAAILGILSSFRAICKKLNRWMKDMKAATMEMAELVRDVSDFNGVILLFQHTLFELDQLRCNVKEYVDVAKRQWDNATKVKENLKEIFNDLRPLKVRGESTIFKRVVAQHRWTRRKPKVNGLRWHLLASKCSLMTVVEIIRIKVLVHFAQRQQKDHLHLRESTKYLKDLM